MNFKRFIYLIASLMLASIASAQSVVIEVNQSRTPLDDYICWSPVPARLRLIEGAEAPVFVRISAESEATGGDLVFGAFTRPYPSVEEFEPSAELNLTLPADGSWVPFNVAGIRASRADKDVSIAARSAEGESLGELPIMVRVRKNADQLSAAERDRFLSGVAALHGHRRPGGPSGAYEKYARAHNNAFRLGIHFGADGLPLFLAWHRAFLLSFERELQAIDPSIALPYWRFDEASSNIFEPNFMGSIAGPAAPNGPIVQFEAQNPLFGWRMEAGGPLVRDGNPSRPLQERFPPSQFDTLPNIFSEPGISEYQGPIPPNGANAKLELRHHNFAHVAAGGWLNSGASPRDPLFFLLHANVDRAWALWQAEFNRVDPNDPSSYILQGSYPGASDPRRLQKGSYAQDVMWPWSREDGSATPADLRDDWPGAGWNMPDATSADGIASGATPANMIDYLGLNGGAPGHGVCYDDIGFSR